MGLDGKALREMEVGTWEVVLEEHRLLPEAAEVLASELLERIAIAFQMVLVAADGTAAVVVTTVVISPPVAALVILETRYYFLQKTSQSRCTCIIPVVHHQTQQRRKPPVLTPPALTLPTPPTPGTVTPASPISAHNHHLTYSVPASGDRATIFFSEPESSTSIPTSFRIRPSISFRPCCSRRLCESA